MKQMADTLEEIDATWRGGKNHDHEQGREIRRHIYRASQHAGRITHYEACDLADGEDCLLVAVVATDTGAQVRVPIIRNVGAFLAAEIVRKLS